MNSQSIARRLAHQHGTEERTRIYLQHGRMERMLKELEWSGDRRGYHVDFCPSCLSAEVHKDDCTLRALLDELEETEGP